MKGHSFCHLVLPVALLAAGMDLARAQERSPATPVEAAKRPAPAAAPKPDPFLDKASGPFTLQRTLDFLKELAAGTYPNRKRLLEAYQNRGVDFQATPENLAKLKEAGADSEFYPLLSRLALPYSAPVVVSTGTIEASCAPLECEISLGKAPPVTTKGGKYVFERVPPGEVNLEFSKSGYVSKSRAVRVQPRSISSPQMTLEPNADTRLEMAKAWLKQFSTGGADDRGGPLREISANGSATLFDLNGVETHWGVTAKLSEKAASNIELRLPSGKPGLSLQCTGGACKIAAPRGRSAIDPDEASIVLQQYRRIHLGNMIWRLTAPEVRVLAAEHQPSGDRVIQMESNDETYEVEIGGGMLIARVAAKSKLGGDAYQVVYGDYVTVAGAAQYPRRTEYRMQNAKRGARIEFTGPVSKLE